MCEKTTKTNKGVKKMAVQKKTTGRKGFTLIELLVVIAIIAILPLVSI